MASVGHFGGQLMTYKLIEALSVYYRRCNISIKNIIHMKIQPSIDKNQPKIECL